MLVKFIAFAAVLAASVSAATAPVYAGCVDSAPAGAVRRIGVLTHEQCLTACAGSKFSYFRPASPVCFCHDIGPAGTDLRPAPSTDGACGVNRMLVEKLLTSYTFQGCAAADGMTYYDDPFGAPVSDVLQCFNYCNDNSHVQFWVFAVFYAGGKPGGPNTGPWCQCSTSTSYDVVPCDSSTAYNYNLERIASASWVVRRADKRRLGGSSRNALCPGTKEACLVYEGSGGFECLDTTSELESCGGCRYGALGGNATAVGEDCTVTPGAVEGATSCISGECVAFACLPGWTLIDGRCWEA
ncbi:uncharacterized protein LOC62_07G009485 [Vanrija pseudolonga]|uniref:Protein CPL1-like domain-containing protein n=1 Tax=Vanrija pseudolonga TaxID=143232 RepID=A0AAF0YHZ4_9TREE|nr:hypothetical protein LOC62_07G009485 [Vanrija pseudolonga]